MDYNDIISKNMNRYNDLRDNLAGIREAADNSVAKDVLDKYNEAVSHMSDLGGGIGAAGMGIHSARKAYKNFKNRGKVKEKKEEKGTPEEEDTEPQVDHSTQSEDRAPRQDPTAEEPTVTQEPLFKDVARNDRLQELNDNQENPSVEDVQNYDSNADIVENKPESIYNKYQQNLTERSKNPNFSSDQQGELNDLLAQQKSERLALKGSEEYKAVPPEEQQERLANLKTNQAGDFDAKVTKFENPENPQDTARNPQPDEPENPLGDEAPVQGPMPKDAPPGSDEAEKILGGAVPEGEEAGLGVAEGVLDALGPIGEIGGAALGIYSLIESLTGKGAPSAEDLKKKAFEQAAPAATNVGVDVAKYQAPTVVGSLL